MFFNHFQLHICSHAVGRDLDLTGFGVMLSNMLGRERVRELRKIQKENDILESGNIN